jgi:hypothetical protein
MPKDRIIDIKGNRGLKAENNLLIRESSTIYLSLMGEAKSPSLHNTGGF